MDPDLEKDLHWQPTRVEWLANAITELNKEISDLERKKLEYEDEFVRLTANEESEK